jgi:hypothetical protein
MGIRFALQALPYVLLNQTGAAARRDFAAKPTLPAKDMGMDTD